MANCNGKCYLAKQLKKVEKKDSKKQLPESTMEKLPFLYCVFETVIGYESLEVANRIRYGNNYSFSYIMDIFHPPKSS